MVSLSIQQFLMLYLWFPLVLLLLFLFLIARFYEKFSGSSTYFRWLLLPIILFGVAVVRYASLDQIAGDLFADLLFGIAGLLVLLFCARLFQLMIWQNKDKPIA